MQEPVHHNQHRPHHLQNPPSLLVGHAANMACMDSTHADMVATYMLYTLCVQDC